jgi:hypothetical protein
MIINKMKNIIRLSLKPKLLCFLLGLLCLTLPAKGNDGSYTELGKGGVLMPIKNDSIVMKKETITVEVWAVDWGHCFVSYNCDFTFHNTTKQSLDVLMGFPVNYNKSHTGSGDLASYYQGTTGIEETLPTVHPVSISNFKVTTVDGLEIPHKISFETMSNPNLPLVEDYDQLFTFKVSFQPAEEKRIINTYNMLISRAYGHPSSFGIDYILKSGLTWKAPIDEATIIIRFHFDYFQYQFDNESLKDQEYKYYPGTRDVQFKYKNYKPERDFLFNFNTDLFNKQTDDGIQTKTSDEIFKQHLDSKSFIELEQLLSIYEEGKGDQYFEHKTVSKDVIRKSYYWLADFYFRKDILKAIDYYLMAFKYAAGNKAAISDVDSAAKTVDKSWVNEGEGNAPAYYIAYNLSCAYSIIKDGKSSLQWLRAAIMLNRKMLDNSLKDTDLKWVRERYKDTFEQFIKDMKAGKRIQG